MNLEPAEAPLDTEIWSPQHIGIYYMFVRIRCDMHSFRCTTPQDNLLLRKSFLYMESRGIYKPNPASKQLTYTGPDYL
nr:hypothetical protein CFP56_44519 [Quercus suber]